MRGRSAAALRLARVLCVALAMLAAHGSRLRAQGERVQVEGRVDGLFAARDALQAGLGANIMAGTYLRLGALGALGASFEDGRTRPSGRVDATVRFLLDPVRQTRWGPYGGGGVSLRHEQAPGWRGYVLLFLGVDGPTIGSRIDPALEVGLGGGTRVGIVLRAARQTRR